MGPPRVSIVVVTSVNLAGLGRCLRSIAATATPEVPSETIVVLNGAQFDADALPAEDMAGVKVVESLANRGFAGGSNLGRQAATGEFIVLLHDDAEAREGWLAQLVRCADEQPEAGAVGARILNPDGSLQLAGAVLWRDGTITVLGPDQPDGYLERRPVDYTGSCALLVRAETWDAVGGLDDRLYPAYYIDVDLALSMRRLGHVVFYEPKAHVVHHKGESTSARFKAFVGGRNAELFRAKWGLELARQEERSEPLDGALERARREAERLAANPTQLPKRPRPESLDSIAAERRFLRLEREVTEGFIAEVLHELAVYEAAFEAKAAELAEAQAESERLRQSASAETEPIGLFARLRALSRLAIPSRKE